MTAIRRSYAALVLLSLVSLFALLSCGQGGGSPAQTTTMSMVDPVKTETPPFTVIQESPLPSLPQAGARATDPNFPGATILRLTDSTIGSAVADIGINNTEVQVQYSYWPVFNKDSTRLHVVGSYPFSRSLFFTFDPVKMEVLTHRVLTKQLPRPSGGLLERSDMIWSGKNPAVIYGHDSVTQLWEYNVANDQYVLIKDFLNNGVLPGEGIKQMSRSLDDQVFAVSLTDAAGVIGYLVWRRPDPPNPEQILRVLVSNLDEVQFDKSGQFLFVGYNTGDVDIVTFGTPNRVEQLTGPDGFFHHDSGHGTIFSGGFNLDFRYRQLAIPTSPTNPKSLIPGFRSIGTQQEHISMLADNERWALVSRFSTTDPPGGNGLFDDEIIQVATDGSNRVRRLAHHRSIMEFPGEDNTPRANISRDGRFVAFTSNWGVALANGGRRDVYIVSIPPAPTN